MACCYKKDSLFLALIDLQRLAIVCCICGMGIPLPPQQPHFIFLSTNILTEFLRHDAQSPLFF